jgi:hypothetical protein
MVAHHALLEACRWSPDDDELRLVWADAVGGERGELVVIQCDLARGGLAPAEAAARRRRERELIARHGDAWAGLADLGARYELRRGFVEAIAVDARTFAEQGEDIFRRAPLLRSLTPTGLTVTEGDPIAELQRLVASTWFWRLQALDLVDVGLQTPAFDYDPGFEGYGDEAARLLAASGALAQLDALGISSSGLTAAGVHHLVASGALARLEALRLRGHDLGADAVLAVLARTPRLTALDLSGAFSGEADLEAVAPALPPVAELRLSGASEATLAALGRSRAAPALERLHLTHSTLALERLRAFPRLHALDLGGAWLLELPRDSAALAAALPALRRLRLPPSMPAGDVLHLGRTLGRQLEQLVLRDHPSPPGLLDALAPHVAGELLTDEPELGPAWLPL